MAEGGAGGGEGALHQALQGGGDVDQPGHQAPQAQVGVVLDQGAVAEGDGVVDGVGDGLKPPHRVPVIQENLKVAGGGRQPLHSGKS